MMRPRKYRAKRVWQNKRMYRLVRKWYEDCEDSEDSLPSWAICGFEDK
jgi:hypothetical protein